MNRFLLGAAALASLPTAVSAATIDFAGDFGSSVFAYGSAQGATFTAYANSYTNCAGIAVLSCKSDSDGSLPVVAATTDGSAVSFSTIDLPANTLLFHPASGGGATESALQFIAPTTSSYTFSGEFLRVDRTNGAGNGVTISIFLNGQFGGQSLLPNTAQYTSQPVFGTLALNAGDVVQFNIGNNGDYTYDATGLRGTISFAGAGGVPEPATWAMLVLGFGIAGAAMRRRQRTTIAFA